MTGPFEALTVPKVWVSVRRQHVHGAHWSHAVEHMLSLVVVTLNDALMDLVDVRHHPRLSLSRHHQPKNGRLLTISIAKQRKHIPLTLGHNAIVLGDDHIIPLNGEGGLMLLVHAIVREIESFWKSNHHGGNE